MDVSATMDLGQLAELMGNDCTQAEAKVMRRLLIEGGYAGRNVRDIAETDWLRLASEAAEEVEQVPEEERLENVIEEFFRENFRRSSKRMVFSSPEQLASFMTFAMRSKLPVGGGYVRSDELQPIIRRVAARLFPVVMNERHR